MPIGLDYSTGVIRGSTITSAGYSFVIRYIGTPGRTKNITRAEYVDLRANKISVWLVYENTVNDILGGYTGGVTAARLARADATSIGYPASGIIFFCADRHLTPAEIPVGIQYIKGAASQLGVTSTGAYGFSEFINAVRAVGAAGYYWQCGSRSAVREGTHFYQRNDTFPTIGGVQCDINDQFHYVPTSPFTAKLPKDDTMYIKCGAAPNTKVAVLSGPIFFQLITPGEKASAEDAIIRQGAILQWVEQSTFDAIARASAGMCATPRMVRLPDEPHQEP